MSKFRTGFPRAYDHSMELMSPRECQRQTRDFDHQVQKKSGSE